VNSLEFYIDGAKWHSVAIPQGQFVYEWNWNTRDTTTPVSDGEHTIKVVASDTAGHNGEVSWKVTVKNEKDPSKCKGSKCGGGIPGFEANGLVVAMMAALVVVVAYRRRAL
jgi:hypothetical protein